MAELPARNGADHMVYVRGIPFVFALEHSERALIGTNGALGAIASRNRACNIEDNIPSGRLVNAMRPGS
jgi:hypothetical protein